MSNRKFLFKTQAPKFQSIVHHVSKSGGITLGCYQCFPFQCYHPVSKARLSLLKNLDVDIIPHTVDVDEDTGNVSSSETESVKNSSCFLLVQLVYANP